MFLGLINSIKEYFSNLNNTSLTDLIPFIIGLIFGFILCLLIYCLVVLTSFKKSEKKAQNEVIKIDDELIKIKIMNIKNQYIDEASSRKTSEKVEVLKESCWDLVNDISKVYYPDSKHPLFELSIDELINLDYYIMKRIEKLFSGKALSKLKKIKISSILNILDMKKKYDENKVVKAANKIKLPAVARGFWAVVNFINPVYWVKKLMIDLPFQAVVNKIALTIIEVVGEETSNIYSKNAFIDDNENIQKQVDEIEKMLGDETYE